MKKINTQQLKQIEDFLDKKDIVYHDLKLEFLDHICSGIEDQWEKHPNVSFNKAFHNEYKKFGMYGFSDILEKRETSLKWFYWKRIGLHSLNWFKIPQIFFTLLVGYTIFQILKTDYNQIFVNTAIIGSCLFAWVQYIRLEYLERKKLKQKKTVLLIDKVIKESSSLSFIFFYIPMYQNTLFKAQTEFSDNRAIYLSILLSIMLFITYMVSYDFPKNKTLYFKHKYKMA